VVLTARARRYNQTREREGGASIAWPALTGSTAVAGAKTDQLQRKPDIRQQKEYATFRRKPEAATTATAMKGQTEMEWEEALLKARGGDRPLQLAAHHRRNAARAREIAAEATTRAIKARLLDEADHCDQLADDADRLAAEPEGL
jgi:hypothetical protein